MSLYTIDSNRLTAVPETTFAAENILERKHLQAMLMNSPSVLGEDLLVLCEEFGNWEDSNRRIDLLCLTKQRGIAVVEIKRTEDGGHSELQAIRYAAMVSNMTVEQAIEAHAKHLGNAEQAKAAVLEFLEYDLAEVSELTGEVRIILASANFSSELTTSVLWLNKRGLDVRCVRMQPHKSAGQIVLDVAQIIPLPEASEYETGVRTREEESKKIQSQININREDMLKRFWTQFIDKASNKSNLFRGKTAPPTHYLRTALGVPGVSVASVCTREGLRTTLRISGKDEAATKAAFSALMAKRAELETAFGGELVWDAQADSACSISAVRYGMGQRSPEDQWPEMQEWLITTVTRMEQVFSGPLKSLLSKKDSK
jgi:hypothetical protein